MRTKIFVKSVSKQRFYSNLFANPPQIKNIKPIAGLRPATHFVVGLSDNCCNKNLVVFSVTDFCKCTY
jgi:hypothetical protein